ncbi:hypothetical protein Pth03_48800 [Planotetraspora thailandica]|uniref:Uncharacterized protein n=1 Tax=Planotetraspora thailandica TaxID=487172 RepID=A0A8J3V7S9_9ACTN|nr:hypothetical protein Pth03_48800 [Planotetraspora thailandica]
MLPDWMLSFRTVQVARARRRAKAAGSPAVVEEPVPAPDAVRGDHPCNGTPNAPERRRERSSVRKCGQESCSRLVPLLAADPWRVSR